MSKYKLSICIPTYNREDLLKETLDSIFGQLADGHLASVEVVVSDNASTDNTTDLIERLQSVHSNLRYFRWSENMGPDRNYLKVIEEARGEYCWFFGSDDILLPSSLEKVLAAIAKQPSDIVLFDRLVSDATLSAPPVVTSWTGLRTSVTFHTVEQREELFNYIDSCTSLGGFFSFLSVILFRKSGWDAVPNKDRFVGSAYVHVHALFTMMAEGCRFSYYKEPLVLCRLGNDTFCPDQSWESIYKRLKLDIDGYYQIVLCTFGTDSSVSRKLIAKLENMLPFGTLVGIRTYLNVAAKEHPLNNLLLNVGYFKTNLKVTVMSIVKKIVRSIRKKIRI
jgi:Glycosyltransferases involved in cell wall biogenesis